MRDYRPSVEALESRALATLVFVFNGNAFAAAKPNALTQSAASQLIRNGEHAIQVSTPAMNGPADFYQLARTVRAMSKGQPIGLLGFSAGGALAMRLAALPQLNVKAVMNFYGPPDFRDWLSYHASDRFYRYVTTHVRVTPGFVRMMSGPSDTNTYIVSAFGLRDQNIVSSLSTASFHQDFSNGRVYYYPGPHGATLYASIPAYRNFLEHL
jgi:hypothetical protein